MKKRIIIIGSGIAGLTFANILKNQSDFEYKIYERESSLNLNEGYGIQLSVNSVSVLNKLGFDKLNSSEKFHPSKLDFFNIKNNKIYDLDLQDFNNEKNQYTTLKRSNLIKFLREELFSNSIKFGKKISKIEKIDSKINILFEDNSTDMADYLIVSDGVFSNSKSIIEKKEIKPKYYGAIAIRATLNAEEVCFNPKNISLIMGSNAHIVVYPVNNQKEMNLVCVVRKKTKKDESIKSILEKNIFKENSSLANLFKGELKSWPIYTSEKPKKSKYKNVFYIGDAFYTFPPTMAQGASQSIESANELFNLINENKENIQDRYFKIRLKRTNQVKTRSELNFFVFHLSNPLLIYLRNLMIKIILKNKIFKESYLGKIFRK